MRFIPSNINKYHILCEGPFKINKIITIGLNNVYIKMNNINYFMCYCTHMRRMLYNVI